MRKFTAVPGRGIFAAEEPDEAIVQHNLEITEDVVDQLVGTNKVIFGPMARATFKNLKTGYSFGIELYDRFGQPTYAWYKILKKTSKFYKVGIAVQYKDKPELTIEQIRDWTSTVTGYVSHKQLLHNILVHAGLESDVMWFQPISPDDFHTLSI